MNDPESFESPDAFIEAHDQGETPEWPEHPPWLREDDGPSQA